VSGTDNEASEAAEDKKEGQQASTHYHGEEMRQRDG
jgi:hypothetical protein